MPDNVNWPMITVTMTVFTVLMLVNEIGYRVGRALDRDQSEPSRTVALAVKGSIIGLVAFLLGFAFSISSNRHDIRRQVVLDDANAIGTLYLRAGLIASPERDQLRAALKNYLVTRLEFFEQNPEGDSVLLWQSKLDRHLSEIWRVVEAARTRDAQSVLVSQLIPAANAVIDLNTTRGWAFRSHTPVAVLTVLLVCVLVSSGLIGHSFGPCQRHPFLCTAFNALFTLTLFLILDYDGPRFGLIRVDHKPLIDLRSSLETAAG